MFFRFSHRNECKETLPLAEQKAKVNSVIKTILRNRDEYQERVIEDLLKFGPNPLTQCRSKTFLNFFDPYFSLPKLMSPQTGNNYDTFDLSSPVPKGSRLKSSSLVHRKEQFEASQNLFRCLPDYQPMSN